MWKKSVIVDTNHSTCLFTMLTDADVQCLNIILFTIQKSSNPFGIVHADYEIEIMVNKYSNSSGGITDTSMNPAAKLK